MAGSIMQTLTEMAHIAAREHLREFDALYTRVEGVDPNIRSIELLKQWLTPRQRADFEDFGCFDVIGNETGQRYRITDDSIYNIHAGNQKICVVPYMGYTPLGDRLLAQKIVLEADEGNALAKANIVSRAQKYPAA